MEISARTKYGFNFLVYLAKSNIEKSIQLGEVAKEEGISIKYLEKIAQIVKRAGLVRVTRGSKGGYRLSRGPETITAKEVFVALEGSVSVINISDAEDSGRALWEGLSDVVEDYLCKLTLKDLCGKSGIQDMYYI